MTEAKEIFPTQETERVESDTKVLWGSIVEQYKFREKKDGTRSKLGPYAEHATKDPPDFHSSQTRDYIGKVGSAKYHNAIAWLQDNPFLPGTKSKANPDEVWKRINSRVGKNEEVHE